MSATAPLTMDALVQMMPLLNQPIAAKILVGSVWVVDRLKSAIPIARTGESSLFAIPIVIDPYIGYYNLQVRDQFDQVMLHVIITP